MIHLGDITKISGYTAPITDCVVGGSPCQDLSIAGKRAGLDGERSGLFMEQIRIIKEMRDRDERDNGRSGVDVRPRYMVWENVPGAFSSNKGEDFRIVLEETARIKDKDAVIPQPPNGKWQTSGCILGDGWSIAWRVLDAQFWGVPQRRRRIALVADFGGHSAPEILFVRKGVSGHPQPSQPQRKATPADATRGIGADDCKPKLMEAYQHHGWRESDTCGALTAEQNNHVRGDTPLVAYSFEPGIASREGGHIYENVSGTLRSNAGDNQMSTAYGVQPVYSVENHPADSRVDIDDTGKVQTLTSRMGTGGGNVPMVMGVFSKSKRAQSATDYETWQESDTANTLNTFDQGDVRTNECVIALDRASYNQGKNAQFDIGISESGTAQSLVAKDPGAVCYSVDQGAGKSSASVLENTSPTLACTHDGAPAVCYSLDPLSSNSMKSSNPHSGCHETDVARTIDTTNPDPSKNQGGVAVVEKVYTIGNGQVDQTDLHEKAGTLNCMHDQQAVMVAEYIDTSHADDVVRTDDVVAPLQARDFKGGKLVHTRYTVRRLTPLECERLQGYPDGWTDIGEYIDSNGKKKQSSDAARYKALGNSIALPPWKWVMKRLCACYERDATLASLFDGIGGFPLIWEQINGKGSCLWASEIEEFPIAVTKVRIGE